MSETPAQKARRIEKARRKFAADLWAIVEEAWDQEGATPMQREKRLRAAEAHIAKCLERRRGH